MENVICPGCGVQIISENRELDRDFNASAACRALCYELSYFTLGLQDKEFIHQLLVDTYAAQHFNEQMKPITITFALVGLYLVNKRTFTGKQVQNVHIALAKTAKNWPAVTPPHKKAKMTVKDVVSVPDTKKPEMIGMWCASVWEIWRHEEKNIDSLLRKELSLFS